MPDTYSQGNQSWKDVVEHAHLSGYDSVFAFVQAVEPTIVSNAPEIVIADDSLAWAAANMDKLRRDYPVGSWVLIKNGDIVGAGEDLIKVLRDADERGIDRPLTIRIEKPSTVRRSAYISWSANRSS